MDDKENIDYVIENKDVGKIIQKIYEEKGEGIYCILYCELKGKLCRFVFTRDEYIKVLNSDKKYLVEHIVYINLGNNILVPYFYANRVLNTIDSSGTCVFLLTDANIYEGNSIYENISLLVNKKATETIGFYQLDGDYGYMSNFYGTQKDTKKTQFKLEIDGKKWGSVEHYFQAQKFKGDSVSEEYSEHIRSMSSPMKAKVLAVQKTTGRFTWEKELIEEYVKPYLDKGVKLRGDWNEVKESIMKRGVLEKFKQNESLAKLLLKTGDARIIEESPKDYFWGVGKDGTGLNKLGKILEEVREELRKY
jgi:ribA/ribD-fused uncharacterized protein